MRQISLFLLGLMLALWLAGCGMEAAGPSRTGTPMPTLSPELIWTRAPDESAPPELPRTSPADESAPLPAPSSAPGPLPTEEGGYFDNALFVGDSIMEGVRQYAAARRQQGEALGTAQFLTSTMGVSLAGLVGDRDVGVKFSYRGEERLLEDIVAEIAPRRVFLMLGLNDLASDPNPVILDVVNRYTNLILRLRSACPEVEFIIITNPPKVASQWLPDYTANRNFGNELIGEFVDELKAVCPEWSIEYVDAYEALKDERGALPDEFCRDGFIHLNHQGAAVVVEALEAFAEGR